MQRAYTMISTSHSCYNWSAMRCKETTQLRLKYIKLIFFVTCVYLSSTTCVAQQLLIVCFAIYLFIFFVRFCFCFFFLLFILVFFLHCASLIRLDFETLMIFILSYALLILEFCPCSVFIVKLNSNIFTKAKQTKLCRIHHIY